MEKKTGRLEAFSDGIFGVAITLLALEISIKEYEGATNLDLWHKIVANWPEYFTYFNSFATVLLIWMGHNQVIDRLRKTNHWLVLLNGVLLLFVVLFPYPTRLVGSFIGTPAVNTAVAFYAGFTGFITLSLLMMNICIMKHKQLLLSQEKSVPWLKAAMKAQVVGFLLYEAAAVLAIYYYVPALAITFFMWVYWGISMKAEDDEEIEKV